MGRVFPIGAGFADLESGPLRIYDNVSGLAGAKVL